MRLKSMLFALAAGASLLAGCGSSQEINLPSASVRVEKPGGVGSGIAIGGGVIITAAHVVGDERTVRVILNNGEQAGADVLWVNKQYDIAAVRAPDAKTASAYLDCRGVSVGEVVSSIGNPMGLRFVTVHGYVSSEPQELSPWKSVFLTDMTTIGGMSGGGLMDQGGRVVGIVVGTATLSGTPDGAIGMVVPSSVVCGLLGRS